MSQPAPNPYRQLPSVDELLRGVAGDPRAARAARATLLQLAKATLQRARSAIAAGAWAAPELLRFAEGGARLDLLAALDGEQRRGLVSVVNATGVVLNTGLGRAPVHPEAAQAMAEAAQGYCSLEVDRESGERNRRDERIGDLLERLCGAEAGLAVNNCAAAVLLVLQTFAGGKQAVVSRGELVEIGGSFRLPDVMQRAGVELVEVGTTNRTRLADYAEAIGPRTGLLLKVHTSNFRQVGFVEQVGPESLARLAHERDLICAYDLGSGLIQAPQTKPLDFLGDEPLLADVLGAGVDVLLFSGDKLLGGPQAGLVIGRKAQIESLRQNPLYRALRLDKVSIAGLERSLDLLLSGRGDELPTRAMLQLTKAQLEPIARRLQQNLARHPELSTECVEEWSQPGSGSAPDIFLPTLAVRVRHSQIKSAELARRLRLGEPPVFARIKEDGLLLDPRTLLAGDEARLVQAFERLLGA